jgi:hypothetical protein
VASNTRPGQNLAFKVSGEGTLEVPQESGPGPAGVASGSSSSAQANNRPGGGLGPPIDAPDPLQQYRWQILGGIAAAFIVGGVYIAFRQQSAARTRTRRKSGFSARSARQREDCEPDKIPAAHAAQPTTAGGRTSMLQGLKEELFQLEVERRLGQISQTEYEKAKSALDQTLERALKREAQRP